MTKELVIVKSEVNSLAARVQQLQINSQQSLLVAVDLLQSIVIARNKANPLFDPQIKAAKHSYQVALDQKKEFLKPLFDAEFIIKSKKTEYDLMVEEAAEQKLKKDRAKIEKQMSKTKDKEKLAVLEEELEEVKTELPVSKVKGMAKQKDWKITIKNKRKLLTAILNDELGDLDSLVDINISGLKTYLKQSKKDSIVGCVVEKTFIQKVTSK